MTTLTDTQVITASGGLVELGYVERTTNQSVTATTFAGASEVFANDLTFIADGSPVLVEFYCPQATNGGSYIIFNLSNGGSTDMGQIAYVGSSAAVNTQYRYTPAAGAQTLNVRAWVQSGTGTVSSGAGGSGQYPPTFLRVSKIVQATQWPAVTTGTIICTSSTRPASPFEGQTIYETDTKKKLTYNGTTWYSEGLQFEASTTTATTFGARQDVTGMTTGSSFTAVSGRRYKATYYCSQLSGAAGERANVSLVVGASTVQNVYSSLSQHGVAVCMVGTFTASGVTTVKVTAARDVGTNTPTLYADTTSPMKLIIEDIGPA